LKREFEEFFCFLADVELLCVYKEEFDEILKQTMATKHENVKAAIRRFDYFKNFTDEKVRFGKETSGNEMEKFKVQRNLRFHDCFI
jgi:hypothetical protein